MAYRYHRFSFYVPFFSVKKAAMALDCTQCPIFSRDRLDIPRLTVTAILIFKCTEGAGVGDYSSREGLVPNRPRPLISFDTHARWQPVTQSARSRWSYGKIEDCEQSRSMLSSFFSAKKRKKKKSVMPQCCHRPACLWGVLFKMATTTIVRKTKRLRSISCDRR